MLPSVYLGSPGTWHLPPSLGPLCISNTLKLVEWVNSPDKGSFPYLNILAPKAQVSCDSSSCSLHPGAGNREAYPTHMVPLPLVCSTLRVEWCFHWYSPSFRRGLQSLTQKHYGVECLFPQSFFPVFSFHFPSILSLWFKLGLRQRGWNGRGQESWEFCQ